MTIELVKILKAAKAHYDCSMNYYKMWEQAKRKDEKKSLWNFSEDEEEKCRGLLEAYEILTGKKISIFEIDEELATC